MTWLKLKDLKGGNEAIQMYLELEEAVCAGPHTPTRDYTEANKKAAEIGIKLHKQIKNIISGNKLDPNIKWRLSPPNSMLDNEFGLRDW